MKKIFLFVFLASVLHSQAQFFDIFAAESDGQKFVTDYTRPVFKGLMYATNAGWITSAKPLKPFHIQLSISGSGAFVPSQDEYFIFNQNDYNYLQIESGPNQLPTVMGTLSQTRMKIVIPDNANNEYKIYEFDAPDGIKDDLPVNAVPAPMIQLSVGLPLGTEANLRYSPKLTSSDGGYFQILGLGIKHSITQYLPKNKENKKPHLNLAIHGSIQNISAGYEEPDSDKAVDMSITSLSFQGMASLDYKFLSFYSAVGYSKGFTSLDILGTYDYTYEIQDNNGNTIGSESLTIYDPLHSTYDLDGLKAKAGIKLNLFFLEIFADYTLQEYPVATAGISLKY